MRWLVDLLTNRCPVCRQGAIFHSLLGMHEACPVCETHFEREPGYFSMSIFIGYIVATAIGIPFLLLGFLLGVRGLWLVALPGIAIVLATPWIFRYGRIIWIYIDQWLDPRRPADGPSAPRDLPDEEGQYKAPNLE